MLLWFRNDLRVHDNPALMYVLNKQRFDNTKVEALFFISKKQWQLHNVAEIKIDLILRHINLLAEQLMAYGITLKVVECDTFKDQIKYLKTYKQNNPNSQIVANKQLEFDEQQRDSQLVDAGIDLKFFEADVIVPKGQVLNKQNHMFKVFTPFKKAWINHVRQNGFDYISKDQLAQFEKKPVDNTNSLQLTNTTNSSEAWPLIEELESFVIPNFLQEKLINYADSRDFPAIKGTSGFSPYLAIGALSPRYLLWLLLNNNPDILTASDTKSFTWLNELIWREFYRHLMHHSPRLSKNSNFNQKYDSLNWLNNNVHFKSWCEGKTGYPIIDAAMRQLNQTGWMHNRLRMLVASFLTKHLLIDWRWGEQYFMSKLIDGDLAANNGGWQWAASTGCDAQPYFRIFNPIRQSEKFDPKGDFIRKYLLELNDIPDKEIHFPHKYIEQQKIECYWPAMIEHKFARQRALDYFKNA